MNRFLVYISILFIAVSCGTKKLDESNVNSISKEDYPYITKFHEGLRLKAKGRTKEAIAKLEECLLIKNDDDAVYYALSKMELMEGNLDKSSQYILRAAEIDPTNTWYIQELAYMYFEQQKFKESVDNFEKLVAIEPRNIEWQYGYAEALVRIGEFEKAIQALNRTEDQIGVNPELSIQKYNLYISAKNSDKALNELSEARKLFPSDPQLIATYVDYYFSNNQPEQAIEMLKELVIADPSNGRAHLALADVYRQQGKDKEAYDELKKAFASPGVDIDTKMKILINIHETSFSIAPEVYELVEMLVAEYPYEAKAHSIKGDYLLRKEKESEALLSYKKALEFDKSQFPIWNQVLLMEYQAGSYADLYQDSKDCLELFPTINTVYLLYGVSSNQLKKYEEAVDALSAGKELVINDKPLLAEFYGQLGEAYFGISEVENGKINYKKAIETDKTSGLLKNNFAYRLAMAKTDLELALSLSKQAMSSAPNHALFIDTYGWVLFQKGDYKIALEEFKKAHEINENDKVNIEHLGDAYFKNGDINEALKWWAKAKELQSKNLSLDRKIMDKKYYEPVF